MNTKEDKKQVSTEKGANETMILNRDALLKAFKSQKKYGAAIIDPPWDVNQKGNYGANQHYDLMTLSQIYNMPIGDLMLDNAHLYLWATNSTLEESYKIVRHWGFEPKNTIIWIKATAALPLGYWFRNCVEYVVFAVRGHSERKVKNQPNIIYAPTQDHSHKPEEFYSIVRRVSPGPYLELFARRPEPDFDAWGNEIASDIVIPDYPVPAYSGKVNFNKHNPNTEKEA